MKVRIAYGAAEGASIVGLDGPIVVIDALRMSATVVVACARGMEVVPVATIREAIDWKRHGALTAGERDGVKIPALDLGNSPVAVARLNGSSPCVLALTTSNGVPAVLSTMAHPGEVLISSPLNLSTMATHIHHIAPRELGIIIAGRRGVEAAEDEMTAALLLNRLGEEIPSDLPIPVPPTRLEDYFTATNSGRKLAALGYAADVSLCAQVDLYSVVPRVTERKPYMRIRAFEVADG